jgi:putative ABC transport system permease protein
MFRYVSLILANSLRNRRRAALTTASMAVSLCLLSMLAVAYRALFVTSEASPAEALRLITHHKVSITQPMPVSYKSKIGQIPGVSKVMVWQWFGGTYRDARDRRNFFARFAIEPEHLFDIRSELKLSQDEKLAFQRLRTGCIIGNELASRFNWRIGDRVTLAGDIFPVTLQLTITGIFSDPNDGSQLYFSYAYLRELMKAADLESSADRVGVFSVLVRSPEDVARVAMAIDQEFENSPAPTETVTERAWQLSFIAFLADLKLFFLSISGALVFTILLVSGNTISMAVRERTREVGVLKTLGFTRGNILGITLGESVFLSLLGGCAGLLLAAGLCALTGRGGTAFAGLKLAVTGDVVIATLVISTVLGAASSLIPAWTASRTSIIDSLRHAG